MADNEGKLRKQLAAALASKEAHAGFDKAIKGLAPRLRGVRPEGLPYSPWELLEHLRLAQHDILDFCVNPRYRAPKWPDDYWPRSPKPPNPKAWQKSVTAYRADRRRLQQLAADRSIDLFAAIPHGEGQTYLRELMLAADHGAYHVGELVTVRRVLGAWK